MGEGTPEQRARPDSLSHGERAGVRGDSLIMTRAFVGTMAGGQVPGPLPLLKKQARSFCFTARLYRKTASRFSGRTLALVV
jgi:hypothetical protein